MIELSCYLIIYSANQHNYLGLFYFKYIYGHCYYCYDVHHIIHGLEKKNGGISYIQMSCVNEHPEFLKMAAQWADVQIEELFAQESTSVAIQSFNRDSQSSTHHHHHHH